MNFTTASYGVLKAKIKIKAQNLSKVIQYLSIKEGNYNEM